MSVRPVVAGSQHPDTRRVMGLLQRLRRRTITARTPRARAYWLRAYLRAKARAGRWDSRMLNRHNGKVTAAVRREIMRGVAAGLVVTSTTGGTHSPTSFHYTGRAVDLGHRKPGTRTARGTLVRYQRACASHPERYAELFGPDDRACVKNRQRMRLPHGSALERGHENHVHVSPA